MARLLITGASGLLGANLLLTACPDHSITAASFRCRLRLPGVACVQEDLTLPKTAQHLVSAARPDVVIHCAAMTDVGLCEEQPGLAARLNMQASAHLAHACV
jgi:dTDP-4-dehydrorhamnose reductase